jgi:multidrug efflux pump subunit AcrA (membrane-fusion protein)
MNETHLLPVRILGIAAACITNIFLAMLIGAFISGCAETGNALTLGADKEEAVYSVRTARAEKRDIQEYFETGGDVITETSVDIFPDIAGKLARLYVGLGDTVRKGDVIAAVDPSKPGLTYALSPVRAPISGTITDVPGKAGATVGPESVIARAGELHTIQVKIFIPEREIGKVNLGQSAAVSFEAYPGEEFAARVAVVSPVVDPVTRTKEARLSFTLPSSRLSVGMFARVTVCTALRTAHTSVPEIALIRQYGGQAVYVVNSEGRVELRTVSAGISANGFVEITAGLSVGETIVTAGGTLLRDGVKVHTL